MADVKSFSSYLNDARKKYGVSQPTQKPLNYTPLPKGTFKEKQEPQSPLSWLVDILSRPMRAVQNPINVAATEAKKRATEGANYNVVGGFFNQLTSPITGFFSTDEQFQPTGSDLIENVTDAIGMTTDKRYKDEQDNVNTALKGGLGFAIDVASDPLTYVPGGIATSFVRGGVKGVQAVNKGVQVAEEVSKVAEATGVAAAKAKATSTSVTKPFASNVVAGFIKGATQGAPDPAFGAFTKRLKPAGLAQWSQKRAYDKVYRASNRLGVSETDLFKVASDPGSAAKIAGKSTKNVSEDQILNASRRFGKIIPKAKTWSDYLASYSTRDRNALRGATFGNDIPEGSVEAPPVANVDATPAAAPSLSAVQSIAKSATLQDAKTLTDSMLARVAGTEAAATPTKVLSREEWAAQQVARARTDGTHMIAHDATTDVMGKALASGIIKNADLKGLQGRLIVDADGNLQIRDNMPAGRKAALEAKLNAAYDKQLADAAANEATSLKAKASRSIMDMVTGPEATSAKAIIGEGGIKALEDIKTETARVNAVKYLNSILSGVKDANEITAFGNTKQGIFADAVFRHSGVDIPGTNARKLQDVENIDSPINIEAHALAEKGETLLENPAYIGMPDYKIRVVANAMSGYLRKLFLNLDGYTFRSMRGALKTAAKYFTGNAKWHLQMNMPDQVNIHVAMIDDLIKEFDELNKIYRNAKQFDRVIAAQGRAKFLFEEAIANSRLVYGWLNSLGVTAAMGVGKRTVHLYADQILSTLAKLGKEQKDILFAAVFNKNTAVPLGNIFEAILSKNLDPNLGPEDILALLKKPAGNAEAKAFNILNEAYSPETAISKDRLWGHTPVRNNRVGAPRDKAYLGYVENIGDEGELKGYYGVIKPEPFGRALANMINDSADELAAIARNNDESILNRVTSESHFMSDKSWDVLDSAGKDADSVFESMKILAGPLKHAEEMGKAGKSMPESQINTAEIIKSRASAESQTRAKHVMEDVKVAKTKSEPKRTPEQQLKAERDAYAENVMKQGPDIYKDAQARESVLGDEAYGYARTEADKQSNIVSSAIDSANKKMNINYGVEDVIDTFSEKQAGFHTAHASMKNSLGEFYQKYKNAPLINGTPITTKAWYDLVNNVDSLDTAAVREELQVLLNRIIGPPGPNRVAHSLLVGIPLEVFQAAMTRAGFPVDIDMDLVKRLADAEGTSMMDAAFTHFNDWIGTADDPTFILEALHYAAMTSQTNKAAVSLIARMPGAVSRGPAKGFSLISKDVNPIDNPLIYNLPNNMHINDEIMGQIRNLEKMMVEPTAHNIKLIREGYLPLLNMWKYSVTVIRLGHHVRNTFGASGIQYLELGGRYFVESGVDALKVMNAKRGDEVADLSQMLVGYEGLKVKPPRSPKAGDVILEFRNIGKVTADMAHEAWLKYGVYTPVNISEDLAGTEVNNKFVKFLKTVLFYDTIVGRTGRKLSKLQNDFNRGAYFMQFCRQEGNKGYYKNWEALAQAAADAARRANPDGSMLTPWEKRNMRLIMPFYAWNRKVVPLMMGIIADRPGRFMLLPKASYNLAVAMGVNPQSMQDPFPEDQLFPSFIKDQLLGPTFKINGKYFNVMPGFAQNDILNTFIGDPSSTIPQQISPFIRVPAELMSGAKWGTNSKIVDLSDYVDSQLPILNYVANISGTSITGSFPSILSGKGFDPQYQVFRENKGPLEQGLSAASWLTGLGFQNMSKDSLITLAEIEKRDRAAQEKPGTKNPF
jgi:hypothetical protein